MPDFITRNGKKIPITGKKAGGGVVVASLLAGVALAGGGLGGGTVGGAADVVAGQGVQLSRAVGNSKKVARRGQHDEAWRRLGLRDARKAAERAADCAVHSYGQVREFFLRTPCRELRRVLFALGDGEGNTFVVSVAWVRMSNTRGAGELRNLADTDGTGNVSPIAAAVLELGEVRFTGRHYDSRPDRSWVVIAEAAPATGRPDPELLDAATEVAVLFPPP